MAEAKTIRVLVARAYWDANEERVNEGTEVELPVDDALEGMETGAFKRIPKEGK